VIWLSIIGLILQLIVKLPEIIEVLKRIFGRLEAAHAVRPLKALREAPAILAALRAKRDQVAFAEKHGLAAAAAGELPCPLAALADDLDARYPDAAS
jgi:hypothetical protein